MNVALLLLVLFLIGASVWWLPMILEVVYHVYFEKKIDMNKCESKCEECNPKRMCQ